VTAKQIAFRGLASAFILLAAGGLLTFGFSPTLPVHSGKVSAAYSRYLSSPSEETKRAYEEAVARASRPFVIVQLAAGAMGFVLLFLLVRVWRVSAFTLKPNRGWGPNSLGASSVVIAIGFWTYALWLKVPSQEPLVSTVMAVGALLLALTLSLVAGMKGSRWWVIFAALPLHAIVVILSAQLVRT